MSIGGLDIDEMTKTTLENVNFIYPITEKVFHAILNPRLT